MINNVDHRQTALLSAVWCGFVLFMQTCLSRLLERVQYLIFSRHVICFWVTSFLLVDWCLCCRFRSRDTRFSSISYFLPLKWGSLSIAFQGGGGGGCGGGGGNVAYHMSLGRVTYNAFKGSLTWVCHVMQIYLSIYFLERVQCNSLNEHSA